MPGAVSVVIPCYNYGRYLERCVTSVLSQGGVEVEVLIIDDCSTDDTAPAAERLATDRRVEVRRHERNRGHIATYNEGLAWASADYTVLLSADDLLTPGSLRRAVRALDALPNVGMLYGRAVRFADDRLPKPRSAEGRLDVWAGRDWIARRCRSATNTVCSPEVVARTALYREIGGYRPELPHTGDLEMWLRLAAHGDVAYLRGVDQAFYRVHSLSMSRTEFKAEADDLRERWAAFDVLFAEQGHQLGDVATLRSSVNQALAREALWQACRAYHRGARQEELDLEALALAICTEATRLREHRALTVRRRLGPTLASVARYGLPGIYTHRAREWLWWHRLNSGGV